MFESINKEIDNGIQDIDICSYFDIGVGSIINSMLFGYRFDEVNY